MNPRHDHPGTRAWRAEAVLIAMGLALSVSYRAFEPIWEAGRGLVTLGVLTGTAYLVGRSWQRRVDGRLPMRRALLVAAVVSQPILLTLWLLDLPVSRIVLAYELVLLFTALAATASAAPDRLRLRVALAFMVLAAVPTVLARRGEASAGELEDGPTQRYVFSSYYDLSFVTHEVLPHETQDGGALTLLPDGGVLLVAGSGDARLLNFDAGLQATRIDLGIPIDVGGYRALGRRNAEFYRVFDAHYDDGSLFVTYTHWDAEQDCYALRLAEAEFDGARTGAWVTRFESQPCIALPYVFNTSGGRIASLDSSRLLVAVGTLGADKFGPATWREDSDYGRLHVIHRGTWSHDVLTVGHRNPEGLLVAGGSIWSTEHGPHGGDELNLIEAGLDYGWPFVSFGTEYGLKTLASGNAPGEHAGFARPIHSWTPSVGVSNLIEVSAGLFPAWQGDLLIGSLSGLGNGRALYRVRLFEGRAVNIERIPTGSRVRDLVQLPQDGPLVLWDGGGRVHVVRPADHFFSACTGCHVVRSEHHGIGPDLYGVVGSQVARHGDYDYSEALRAYGGAWTLDRLDRFLESPQREVPGTSMEHEGVPDLAERMELVQFLSEIAAGRPEP